MNTNTFRSPNAFSSRVRPINPNKSGIPNFANPFLASPPKSQSIYESTIPEYNVTERQEMQSYNQYLPVQAKSPKPLIGQEDSLINMNQMISAYKANAYSQFLPQKIMEIENKIAYAESQYKIDIEENKNNTNQLIELTEVLHNEIKILKKDMLNLKSMISSKEEEINTLNNELEYTKTKKPDSTKSSSMMRNPPLTYAAKYNEEKIDEMVAQFAEKEANYKNKISKLETGINELQKEKEKLEENTKSQNKEKTTLSKQVTEISEKHSEIEKEYRQLKNKYNEEKIAWEETKEKLEQEKKLLNKSTVEHSKKSEISSALNSSTYIKQAQQLQEENKSLNMLLQKEKQEKEGIALQYEQALNSIREQNMNKTSDIENDQQSIAEVTKSYETKISQLEKINKELTLKINSISESNNKAKSENEEILQTIENEKKQAEEEVDSLKKKLNNYINEISNLKMQIKIKDEKIEEVDSQLKTERSKQKERAEIINKTAAENEAKGKQIEILEGKLRDYDKKLTGKMASDLALVENNNKLIEHNKSLKVELEELKKKKK